LRASNPSATASCSARRRIIRSYLAAVLTGMRQGELLALRWEDCELVFGRVQVRRTLWRVGKRWGFKEPKTPSSRRVVPLSPPLVEELLRLRTEQEERKRKLGDRYHDLDLVFCNHNGGPLQAHNLVRRDFRKVLARAKLPMIRFHDLRHTAATRLFGAGVHPKAVADLLGHASIGTTMNVYTHAIPALAEEAVRRLGELLVARSAEGN